MKGSKEERLEEKRERLEQELLHFLIVQILILLSK